MTVAELIEQLKQMPQDVHVYAEGEPADKAIFEKSPDGNGGIVRIFKAWDVEFVGRGIESPILHFEPDNCGNYIIQEPTIKNNSLRAVIEDEAN